MPELATVASLLPGYDPEALSIELAQQAIARFVEPLREGERVGLREALLRITAEDVISPIDVPSHDNSAMDGFALCAADLNPGGPTLLREVGVALAGKPWCEVIGPGECVRIMTGAVMPARGDTVVPQELVSLADGHVTIPAGQTAGQHRRLRGEDLKALGTAVCAGTRLRAPELGLLASLGIADVPVLRRLRVAILSTGNEIRSLGEPLRPGAIYDSNRFTLYGMLQGLGVEIVDLGVVGDDPLALESALRQGAKRADALITSGGVSVGEADFTRALLSRLGDVAFWRIAMKPGRPMAFGRIEDEGKSAFLFGLPGNPVAVMVTFLTLVQDALLQLAGAKPRILPRLTVRSDTALTKKSGRTEYQRGIAYLAPDGWHVRVTGAQGSGILRSMSEANCLIVLPHASTSVAPGDLVEALPFEGLL
jgi:molybdopterin molybdotransferase